MLAALVVLLTSAAANAAADPLLPSRPDAPGCALDVRRDGVKVESRASGLANLENPVPLTQGSVLEVGSVSKQFIGAGIALLAGEDRLKLEDSITKWLPELPELYNGVTISMLVHHTSGIRSWNNLAELTGRGEDSTGYDNAWVLSAVSRQMALNNKPGDEYLYSNSNFVLAATIIERASGRSLNEFYVEEFFSHLGMTHTRWRSDFREIVPNRAQAYAPNDKGGWQLDMPLNEVAGAGGLLSTVGDLQLWNATLMNPAMRDSAWVAALRKPGSLNDGATLTYGMGIETAPLVGVPAFSHAGSTGSYRAWLGLFPSQALSIALLCNSGEVNTEELGPQIAERFLVNSAPASGASTASANAPSDVVGLYRNVANDSKVEVTADGTGLHFNGGPAFNLTSPDRLSTEDGKRSAVIARAPAGQGKRIRVTRTNNAPIHLVSVTPWKPTKAELSKFIGTYTSPEIEGSQRIEAGADGLVWRDPSGAAHPLGPIYTNAFFAVDASWTLYFSPGDSQSMNLHMSITRARRIAFKRQHE